MILPGGKQQRFKCTRVQRGKKQRKQPAPGVLSRGEERFSVRLLREMQHVVEIKDTEQKKYKAKQIKYKAEQIIRCCAERVLYAHMEEQGAPGFRPGGYDQQDK